MNTVLKSVYVNICLMPIQNSLKQEDKFLPLLFNFTLDYVIMKIQENQEELELKETHQLLVCADNINLFNKNKNHKENHRNSINIRIQK